MNERAKVLELSAVPYQSAALKFSGEEVKQMVMSLDEPIRQLIDGFATGTITLPTRIGAGSVYFVPSRSELGEFYIVSEVGYMDHGKSRNAWICGCKAFRFGQQGDWCKHIRTVQDGIETQIKVMKKKRK